MIKHLARIFHRAKRGFSLAETLVALLIVVMLTGFVASGIPVAFSAYRAVVSDTNAQVAMSTTASALRDELGLAVAIGPVSDRVVVFQKADGTWVKIENGPYGLKKHIYRDVPGEFPITTASMQKQDEDKVSKLVDLVPEKTIAGADQADDLRVQMEDVSGSYITYANGVFTVNKIAVCRGSSTEIEHIDDYTVRAVMLNS